MGIPVLFYTVLAEVGSGLITHLPYHPQSKGKIEKLKRFIQDCFLKFLKNQKVQTLEELNQAFKRWLNWYDSRKHRSLGIAPKIVRAKLIQEKKVAFRPLPKRGKKTKQIQYFFLSRKGIPTTFRGGSLSR